MSNWLEFEIKNFRGINRSSTPDINEASEISNLDPRGIKGELTNAPGYSSVYAVPSGLTTLLGVGTFIINPFGTEKEITVYVGSGTVTALAGSGASNKNIMMFFVRPYYNGSGWVDSWLWLNEIDITKIASHSSYYLSPNDTTGTGISPLDETPVVIYNETLDEYCQAYAYDNGTEKYNVSKASGWSAGNTIIVMRNFFPIAYLEEMYNATAAEISMHHVLNDIRIAAGGKENRLGVSIGWRKKTFHLDSLASGQVVTNFDDVEQICFDPYNCITTEAGNPGTVTYDIQIRDLTAAEVATLASGGWAAEGSNMLYDGQYGETIYYKVAAVLDGFNEFVVCGGLYTMSDTYIPKIFLNVDFASMNKRVTKFNVYLAVSAYQGGTTRLGNYQLVKEIEISGATNEGTLDIDSDGKLVWATDATDPLIIYKEDYDNSQSELSTALGSLISDNYVRSWDHAVVAQGRAHLVNPFIKQRYDNKIFMSAIAGNGAFMYDVVNTNSFYDLESRDGDTIVGVELLPNADILAVKRNSAQVVDTNTGNVRSIDTGVGTNSKHSIVNSKNMVAWVGKYGVLATDSLGIDNITDSKIKDLFESYVDQDSALAGREEKGSAFRMRTDADNPNLYYMKEFGWWAQEYNSDLIVESGLPFAKDKDGLLLFVDSAGAIKKIDYGVIPGTYTYKQSFSWLSVPIGIQNIGDKLKATNRIWLNSIWLDYEADQDIKLSYSIYGAANVYKTIPASKTYYRWRIGHGLICKSFKIGVSGEYWGSGTDAWSNKLRIKAIGVLWKPYRLGHHA